MGGLLGSIELTLFWIPKAAVKVLVAILTNSYFLRPVISLVYVRALVCAAKAAGGLVVLYVVGVRYAALALAPAFVFVGISARTCRLILIGLTFTPAAFVRYATRTWTRPALAALLLPSAVLLTALLAGAWVWFAALLPAAWPIAALLAATTLTALPTAALLPAAWPIAALLAAATLTALLGAELLELVICTQRAVAISVLWSFHGVFPLPLPPKKFRLGNRCACPLSGLSGDDAFNVWVVTDQKITSPDLIGRRSHSGQQWRKSQAAKKNQSCQEREQDREVKAITPTASCKELS